MKALVTGGAGFIGSNIVKELLSLGHEVTVLDNYLSGYKDNLLSLKGVEIVEGDIRDESVVNRVMQGKDTVFHLAASVGNKRSIDLPLEDSAINVMGTLNVLEAARKHGVTKLVASSSAGIYGELKELPIHESHPLSPLTPYASSKLCMENHCLSYANLYDIDVVCLRYFNVYGPNQRFDAYGNVIPIFVFSLLRGERVTIFGDGNQTRDFVNVKDVVQANIKAALAENVSGAYNTASATTISINDLYQNICNVLGIDRAPIYGDKRPGDVLDSCADVNAAKKAFGFNPTVNISESLVEYINWAKTIV